MSIPDKVKAIKIWICFQTILGEKFFPGLISPEVKQGERGNWRITLFMYDPEIDYTPVHHISFIYPSNLISFVEFQQLFNDSAEIKQELIKYNPSILIEHIKDVFVAPLK